MAINILPLPASVYNELPTFEQQIHETNPADISEIGKLFIDHGAHNQWGISLPHRHFELDSNQIMVHEATQDGVDMCKARDVNSIDTHRLTAHSFVLDSQSTFQAYEYSMEKDGKAGDGQPEGGWHLNAEFLRSLAELLYTRGLSRRIGLALRPPQGQDSRSRVETIQPALRQTTTSAPSVGWTPPNDGVAVETSWCFNVPEHAGTEVAVIAVQKCVKHPLTQVHSVVD